MSLSPEQRSRQRQIFFPLAISVAGVALVAYLMFGMEATYQPGEIIDGTNTVLNPDGGTFMSNQSGDGTWTIMTEEYGQFEAVAGSGGANRAWDVLSNAGYEPTGTAEPHDTQSGGGCANTDIVTDSNGGDDYAYYSIIDPDAIADNGDEILAFAVRLSDQVSGAFTISILVDARNDIRVDVNEVCGNPGFEYEIQMSTQQNRVNLIKIDGCAGQADCDDLHGGDATVCAPCNAGALQVRAGSGECTNNSLNPVFWMGHIPFNRLTGINSTDDFRLVVATTTSPNEVIYKGTNVADYGGIGDPNASTECDCANACAGSACSDCERDCALACAATNETSFPVEWREFHGHLDGSDILLQWATDTELNNDSFEVQQLSEDNRFEALGQIKGAGTTTEASSYQFTTPLTGSEKACFRLRQVDVDGKSSYSPVVEIALEGNAFQWYVHYTGTDQRIQVSADLPAPETLHLRLISLDARILYQEQWDAQPGQATAYIPSASLPVGTYVIQLENPTTGKVYSKRVSISR